MLYAFIKCLRWLYLKANLSILGIMHRLCQIKCVLASIAQNKGKLYLLLALDLHEVLSFATLSLFCAVLLQVLQFGGSRGVEKLPAT